MKSPNKTQRSRALLSAILGAVAASSCYYEQVEQGTACYEEQPGISCLSVDDISPSKFNEARDDSDSSCGEVMSIEEGPRAAANQDGSRVLCCYTVFRDDLCFSLGASGRPVVVQGEIRRALLRSGAWG